MAKKMKIDIVAVKQAIKEGSLALYVQRNQITRKTEILLSDPENGETVKLWESEKWE